MAGGCVGAGFGGCCLFLASSLTPVHVGVGRSPGVVDLPIARDGFGFPYLPGSGLKGSAKSLCMRLRGDNPRPCTAVYGWDLRLGDSPEDAYASPVLFTDGFLLAYPVRAEEEQQYGGWVTGFGLATSRLLLTRFLGLLGACRGLDPGLRQAVTEALGCGTGFRRLYMNGRLVEAAPLEGLREVLAGLLEGDPLARYLLESGGLYLVEDDDAFREVVEAGVLRQARVRLDYRRKTVETGGLWTEEYVSQGAVFYFAVVGRGVEHPRAMDVKEALWFNYRLLCEEAGCLLQVGGKETVGKGLLRLHRVEA